LNGFAGAYRNRQRTRIQALQECFSERKKVQAGGWAGSPDGEVLWFEMGILASQAPHLKIKNNQNWLVLGKKWHYLR